MKSSMRSLCAGALIAAFFWVTPLLQSQSARYPIRIEVQDWKEGSNADHVRDGCFSIETCDAANANLVYWVTVTAVNLNTNVRFNLVYSCQWTSCEQGKLTPHTVYSARYAGPSRMAVRVWRTRRDGSEYEEEIEFGI
jgi:hypothetical protein